MQSYTLYQASEFLKDRHPYIPDPNPRPLMDPEQVAIAYNERAVPKLADLLIYPPLSSQKRRDALHTLNELVSHQETKCDMITHKITLHATCLMVDDNPEVIRIGVTQARTVALFFCLLSFSHCIAAVCRGAGKAFIPMLVMLGVWCVLRITYITVAMHIKHVIKLLFIAYPLTWFISSVIFAIYYLKSNWIEGFSKN